MHVLSCTSPIPQIEVYQWPKSLHKLSDILINYEFLDSLEQSSKCRSVTVVVGIESQGQNLIVRVGSLPGLKSIRLTNLPLKILTRTKVSLTQVSEALQILVATPSGNSVELLKISINGFINWVKSLGLGAENLLQKQRVRLCLSPVMSVTGQLIDLSPAHSNLSPAHGDCAVVTTALETGSSDKKEIACFWVDFKNQCLSNLFTFEVDKGKSFQVQFLGSGLLVRSGRDLSYRPLSGTSLQEASHTWQGVELLQRASFSSLVCVLNSAESNASMRRLLHLSKDRGSIQVNDYDVSKELAHVRQFLQCRAYTKEGRTRVAFLTVEQRGLWAKTFEIKGRSASLLKNKMISEQVTKASIKKYELTIWGTVREKVTQLPLLD